MYPIQIKRNLRSNLLLGASMVAAAAVATPAMAQDQQVETVVVTGSRIPQQGLYSTSPVTAIGQQELKDEGATDVATLLNNLPAVTIDQSGSADNGSTGTSNVDLRDLGSKRTLVLVDGTRLMPGDPVDPVADVNNIPAALVDHVEVLTGGASAVYGSDAVAGVVNFIMRHDFEGVEVDGQIGVNEHDNDNGYAENLFNSAQFSNPLTGATVSAPHGTVWDGQNHDGTLIIGANSPDDKGNVTAYVNFRNQEMVSQGARDFSACAMAPNGPNARVCEGSETYAYYLDLDNAVLGTGGPPTYSFFNHGTGKVGSGTFDQFSGAPNEYFNFADPYQQLERPDTRYSGGYFAHYQASKMLDVYSDFMFTADTTRSQLGPSGVFYGTGPISGAYQVNCTNPYLTAQENQQVCGLLPGDALVAGDAAATALGHAYYNGAGNLTPGQAAILIARRNVEGGPRSYTLNHDAYRMKVGARGDLGGGWDYDVYAQYGYTAFSESDGGQLLLSNVINALQVDPVTGQCIGGASGCVGLDLFNGFGGITPAMEDYIGAPALEEGFTKEEIISGAITGDLGAEGIQSPWAKNPVGVSLGGEYREEGLGITPDLVNKGGLAIGGSAIPDTHGQYNVTEVFGEVKIPLVQNVPWAEDLSLNGGYRYSSYNTSGAATTFKVGAEWQPVDDIRFRASYDRAVRAPNVLELFFPQTLGLFGGNDPCSPKGQPDATVIHNCETAPGRANVPASSIGNILLNCPASQCVEYGGGNPNLKPETALTRSLGLVFTPTFLDGFTATIDYFNIKVSNAIGIVPESTTLNECYGDNATAASQAQFCPLVFRTAGTHSISVNSTVPATSGYVLATGLNTGGESTEGIDFEANYALDLDTFGATGDGSLSFNFLGTWLDNLKTLPISGLGSFDCAGLYGDECGTPEPHWRHKLRVTWNSPWDFSLSLQWRYFGGVSLDQNSSQPQLAGAHSNIDSQISAYNWFDLSGTWNVRQGVELRAGVNNLFDKDPPITGYYAPPNTENFGTGNTFPGTYDTLGRQIFVGATIKY